MHCWWLLQAKEKTQNVFKYELITTRFTHNNLYILARKGYNVIQANNLK